MDFLSEKIIEAVSKNIKDAGYIKNLQHELKGLDRLASARKIAKLDEKNLTSLAEILGLETDDLMGAIKFFQKI